MSRDEAIYKKLNEAIRTLADIYDILNTKEDVPSNPKEKGTDLLTIKAFCEKYPTFTQGAIRFYIHDNKKQFKERVCLKMGKRIYIREAEFFKWIEG